MNLRPLLICIGCILAIGVSAFAQNETVLYSFGGRAGDGTNPFSGVIADGAGNLYGVTPDGGANNVGTVYELTAEPRREIILYSFTGGDDGAFPIGGLILDSNGNLFGTTQNGANPTCSGGCGTVFELSAPTERGGQWTETVLYNFSGGTDGGRPYAGVIFDNAGNLYGTTALGGGSGSCQGLTEGCGTVFELSPRMLRGGTWTETVLFAFTGGSDGGAPNAPVIFAENGNLYGTTTEGGSSGANCVPTGCGLVFELSPSGSSLWNESVLHRFSNFDRDGANPLGGLVIDGSGDLIGTTTYGGIRGGGTIFGFAHSSTKEGKWTYSVLYYFDSSGQRGDNPESGMIALGENGDVLYGTTASGGKLGRGTVFRLAQTTSGLWEETGLYSFGNRPDGFQPIAGIVFHNGALYGTTVSGGSFNKGIVFRLK